MKTTRKIIQIDEKLCDGCGECVPSCAEGALQIINGKARVVSDSLCDGLGACMGECPNGALQIIEREADEFDESAVEKHLSEFEKQEKPIEPALACGCPSQQIRTFIPTETKHLNAKADAKTIRASALSHWPIQIRLIPADAKFLQNADLLVIADCAAVSYPGLHDDLLAGKVVMMGCPKFDDADGYIQKFKEVFAKSKIKSLTIVTMEVPCCSGLPWIVKKALETSPAYIPITEMVISPQGTIISQIQHQQKPARVSA